MLARYWFGMVSLLIAATLCEGAEPGPPSRPSLTFERIPDARFQLEGLVRGYADRITRNWLMVAPDANPAILEMFRDRDQPPYRDLLPWSGEFAGKYLTGATQMMRLTGDPALRQRLQGFVSDLTALQDKDGYLGPFPRDHRLTGSAPNVGEKGGPTWDAWGHYHAIVGLLQWYQETQDPKALAAAKRIGDLLCDRFLGDKHPRLVDTGSTEMNLAPAHGLCLLAERTGDSRYLDLARQLVKEFAATDAQGNPLAGDYLRRGLAGAEFFTLPKPRWESLHPMLALATLAQDARDDEARRAFENLWWSIVKLDRHNNGGFSSGEQAQGNPYHPGAIETCCTIAWMTMSLEMLKMTGSSLVADELELSTLNSALGMYAPTGQWSTYNTPMDGVRRPNTEEIAFQIRPGSPGLNCCSVNAARGVALISEWAIMRAADGLVLNWYGPGTITASLASGATVRLVEETTYPREGTIRIRVEPEQGPAKFSLRLRVPQWSAHTTARLNGEAISDVPAGRYLEIARDWKTGDTIELDLDLSPHWWVGERESAGKVSLYRGPLLLTYDPRFNDGKDAIAPLDARNLQGRLVKDDSASPPIVLVEFPTGDGGRVRLCDFASAGAEGSPYRSWLPVEHAAPTPFSRDNPLRSGRGLVPRVVRRGICGPDGGHHQPGMPSSHATSARGVRVECGINESQSYPRTGLRPMFLRISARCFSYFMRSLRSR